MGRPFHGLFDMHPGWSTCVWVNTSLVTRGTYQHFSLLCDCLFAFWMVSLRHESFLFLKKHGIPFWFSYVCLVLDCSFHSSLGSGSLQGESPDSPQPQIFFRHEEFLQLNNPKRQFKIKIKALSRCSPIIKANDEYAEKLLALREPQIRTTPAHAQQSSHR